LISFAEKEAFTVSWGLGWPVIFKCKTLQKSAVEKHKHESLMLGGGRASQGN